MMKDLLLQLWGHKKSLQRHEQEAFIEFVIEDFLLCFPEYPRSIFSQSIPMYGEDLIMFKDVLKFLFDPKRWINTHKVGIMKVKYEDPSLFSSLQNKYPLECELLLRVVDYLVQTNYFNWLTEGLLRDYV